MAFASFNDSRNSAPGNRWVRILDHKLKVLTMELLWQKFRHLYHFGKKNRQSLGYFWRENWNILAKKLKHSFQHSTNRLSSCRPSWCRISARSSRSCSAASNWTTPSMSYSCRLSTNWKISFFRRNCQLRSCAWSLKLRHFMKFSSFKKFLSHFHCIFFF